jgi:hypothetical protein
MPPLLTAFAGIALLAQNPAPAPSPARPAVTVGVERRAEHYRYRFDHPSTFDTVDLVPHFFEQRYDAGNTWLVASTTYALFRMRAWTEFGVTPTVTTAGSDIDTFIQPSGDVVTSGTAGRVRLRSMSVEQRLGLRSSASWTIGVAIGYRRARADFLPDDIIVTHTQPVSQTRTFTTTRETTVSRVLQSGVMSEVRWRPAGGWRVAVAAEALPVSRARLTTRLPDKYDHDIVDDALAFGTSGRMSVEHAWSHLVAGAAITASGAWGYRRTSGFHAHSVGVGVFVRTGR